jgi:hypothetical protein
VTAPKWWGVHNHIGTFHAIAACNLAEIAMGMLAEATVPASHRWLPKGMTVEYVAKAETGLRAVAELPEIPDFGDHGFVPVVPASGRARQLDPLHRRVPLEPVFDVGLQRPDGLGGGGDGLAVLESATCHACRLYARLALARVRTMSITRVLNATSMTLCPGQPTAARSFS